MGDEVGITAGQYTIHPVKTWN